MAGGLHTFGSWLGAQSMLRRSPNEGSVLAGHLQMKSRQRLLSPEDRSLQQQELVSALSFVTAHWPETHYLVPYKATGTSCKLSNRPENCSSAGLACLVVIVSPIGCRRLTTQGKHRPRQESPGCCLPMKHGGSYCAAARSITHCQGPGSRVRYVMSYLCAWSRLPLSPMTWSLRYVTLLSYTSCVK